MYSEEIDDEDQKDGSDAVDEGDESTEEETKEVELGETEDLYQGGGDSVEDTELLNEEAPSDKALEEVDVEVAKYRVIAPGADVYDEQGQYKRTLPISDEPVEVPVVIGDVWVEKGFAEKVVE